VTQQQQQQWGTVLSSSLLLCCVIMVVGGGLAFSGPGPTEEDQITGEFHNTRRSASKTNALSKKTFSIRFALE
jgi:hypothetical protein